MTGEAININGTALNIALVGTTTPIATGGFQECSDDDRQAADSLGYKFGTFEITLAAGGFSAAPTAGARFNIYEQTINSSSVDGPAPDANYTGGFIGSVEVNSADVQQALIVSGCPLNISGGKYWVEWVDGGSGTSTVDAGWKVDLIPTTIGPAA